MKTKSEQTKVPETEKVKKRQIGDRDLHTYSSNEYYNQGHPKSLATKLSKIPLVKRVDANLHQHFQQINDKTKAEQRLLKRKLLNSYQKQAKNKYT